MNPVAAVALSLVLAASAADMKACRKVVVNGPKTEECRAGRYVTTVDDAKNPPELSYVCETPTSPAPPSPSAPPSTPPSAEPSPEASPSPSAPPPSPSPTPVPSATPTPAPSPSASPSAPPVGPDGNYPLPAQATLPPWFDVAPYRVGLGAEPKHQGNGTASWHVYLFHATPRDQEPRCPHKPDGKPDKVGECEQWGPAADAQASRGEGPLWWFAEYPGTSCSASSYDDQRQCGVEHPSRPCTTAEKDEDVRNRPDVSPEQARSECARPHGFVGRDRVGDGGGPPGVRTVCVAPHGEPTKAECRRWDLPVNGAWSAR